MTDVSGDTESATADADSSPTDAKSATADAESTSSAAESASADKTAGAADSDAARNVVVTEDGTVVTDESDADGDAASSPAGGDAEPDGFGRQGWLLVVGVVVCFLGIPGVVYLKPAVPAAAGLPFFASFLVLPLLPAVGLGLLAVWSMRAAA